MIYDIGEQYKPLSEEDMNNPVIIAFKNSNTHMWFRKIITDKNAVINNLPLL